jgi:multicomponent Na+:H+ antiporter subunit E
MKFLATAIAAYIVYLLLTIGTGDMVLWNGTELIIGAVFAIVVGALVGRRFIKDMRMLNPWRWLLSIIYIFPFFWAMTRANIDVAYRVITGRINPGIVKIEPRLKNDAAVTLLATSITLTPGTLSVDVDEKNNDLYVHWINVDSKALQNLPSGYGPVCSDFPDWARRIAD